MAGISRAKLEFLQNLEKKIQLKWEQDKTFEVDASEGVDQEKCFVVFPMPYMNEKLHLGHAFTLTKCEFYVRYQRLKGKVCLLPFAFHGTGTAINSCVQKLKNELDQNQLALMFDEEYGKNSKNPSPKEKDPESLLNIIKSFGLKDSQILKLCEEQHWLDYFSMMAMQDLKRMGLHIDWRRSFATADKHILFERFVQWQFRILKNGAKILCSDQDLTLPIVKKESNTTANLDAFCPDIASSQRQIAVKFLIEEGFPKRLSFLINNGTIYLIVAILRPESLAGLTNFWVNPELDYVAFPANDHEVYVCSLKAATTLNFQGVNVSLNSCISLKGHELVGVLVSSPMSHYTSVYVLPSSHVKSDSGTGILPCFPSQSPYDYIHFEELKEDQNFFNTYKISESAIKHFTPVPVIDVPVLGIFSAIATCNMFDVNGLNDTDKLEKANVLINALKNSAVMMSGELKGMNVNNAKQIISLQLIANNEAIYYYKRIGKTASEDRPWYINYADKQWKQKTKLSLENVATNDLKVKRNIEVRLQKLAKHPCTTTYGLGSRLPWDKKYLIEPLSDSTIYMAYMTISHILDVAVPEKIRLELDLSFIDELFDYIFLGKKSNHTLPIDPELIVKMKKEFEYWYPVDLICAEKKLIKNHVLFLLYHHTAVWPETYPVPKTIKLYGTFEVNSLKLSKENKNVLTISEAIEKYGADATRFALADAGDSLKNANFNCALAEAAVLKLHKFIQWAERKVKEKQFMRNTPPSEHTFHDEVFYNEICLKMNETSAHYSQLSFKKALLSGFFNLQSILRKYKKFTGDEGFHWDMIKLFIKFQAVAIAPICPHVAEHVYSSILNEPGTVTDAPWPTGLSINLTTIEESKYLVNSIRLFKQKLKWFVFKKNKAREKPARIKAAHIWVTKSYNSRQKKVMEYLINERYERNIFPCNRKISQHLRQNADLKPHNKKLMTFVQDLKDRDTKEGVRSLEKPRYMEEFEILTQNKFHLRCALEVEEVTIHTMTEPTIPIIVKEKIGPLEPQILFELKVEVEITLINCQPFGSITMKHVVCKRDMSYHDLRSLVDCDEHYDIDFWRCQINKEEVHECLKQDCKKIKVLIPRNAIYNLDRLNEKLLIKTESEVCPLGKTLYYVINNLSSSK